MGTEATVEGWADSDIHNVLIDFLMHADKVGPQEVTHVTAPRNLQRTCECLDEKDTPGSSKDLAKPQGSSEAPKKKSFFGWG